MKDCLKKICRLTNQKKQPKSMLRHCLNQALNLWMGLINKLKLAVSVVSDYARYKCDIDKIIFRPTMMFGSRSYKYELKNISAIALHYSFKIINPNTGISDSGPFSITPRSGLIPAGTDEILIVTFSPEEVNKDFSRLLSCKIPNLSPDLGPLSIMLDGVAERPDKNLAPIDSKYRIIEFESLGVKVKNTNRFMVVNPTSHSYDFEWEEVESEATGRQAKREMPVFRCLTPKGTILSGKKFEMVFEYTPDNFGEHEGFWNFKIPFEDIAQPFMTVGYVVEPVVLLETGKVNFGPLLLGGKSKAVVNLINQEHLPFAFNLNKESIRGNPDYGDSLAVTPLSGTVPPQSQIPLEVLFKPKYEMSYNYNVICNIKRKARPLMLNIKSVGYSMHHSVFADKQRIPVSPDVPHSFDFGDFFVNEKKVKSVVIENSGDFNFDFIWKGQPSKYIIIQPETGTVKKGDSVSIDIIYLPLNPHKLADNKCSLKIVSGPKFNFLLNGTARKPGISLSFLRYDFGPCFVTRQSMSSKAVLELVNNDNSAISIETNFEAKPHLDVQLSPGEALLPATKGKEDKLAIPIIFTPREIKKYREVICFDFNGIYKVEVEIKGEGIPMNLELVDPEQHIVNFGIVAKGADVTKTVGIINKSRKPVAFALTSENPEDLKKNCLSITPTELSVLKPNKVLPIEVRFNPSTRMPEFAHDILLDIKGNETRKLFTVQGVAHGIELKLMEEVVEFGSVVKGSRLTKQLQLANFGDVRAKFKWDSKVYASNFTIFPESGYIPPHEDIYLEITFHPSSVDDSICAKNIKCEYTGGSNLSLTLMGKCVSQDKDATKELYFETIVRKAVTQKVTISNPTDKDWRVQPTISTSVDSVKDYFRGNQHLDIPPKSSADYQVTYLPLAMTKVKGPSEEVKEEIVIYHETSLFFSLPDGRAELYNLFGKSNKPEATDNLTVQVDAKKSKYISMPVENWLKTAQRFKVTSDIVSGADNATFIRGANTFDVQGNSTKEYKLNFLTYKAGETNFKVSFLNETTGEYLLFNVKVVAGEPEIHSTIELAAQVRETVSKIITVENPTAIDVEITKQQFSFVNEYIEISPDSITIPAQSERGFEVCYRPLAVGESKELLTLRSEALGIYKYELLLKGLPSTAQNSLHFKCCLGADLMQQFKFKHFLKKATVYAVKCEDMTAHPSTCFKVEVPNIPAPIADSNGANLALNIRFEPNIIGESRAIVKLTSPENLEYSCMLYGHSSAPQPQGPYKVPAGKPVGLEFKNPLVEKAQFIVTFDNPSFSLAAKLPDSLDPGKPVQLQVKYDVDASRPTTGRMIISTKGIPPWIYYLQGE